MHKIKYFDHSSNIPLDLELDGCDLSTWHQLHGKAKFARHPLGFKVFLPPEQIASHDEYSDFDPYSVQQNLGGTFHTTRIQLTLELLKEAIASTPSRPKVLDLGCGQGHITQALLQALPHAEFTALDSSISAITYAHTHSPKIDFAVADAYNAPYAREYFDVVVCNNLWEHVPDPVTLLSRIRLLVKPDGYIILSTPSRYRSGNLLRVLIGKRVAFMSKHHVTEYTVGQVIEQLSYGHFLVTRITSRPLATRSGARRLLDSFLKLLLVATGSHHRLEATVFYLARKSQ